MTMQATKWKYLVSEGQGLPPSGDKPSLSPVYENSFTSSANLNDPYDTLYDMFDNAVRQFSDRPCLGCREVGSDGKPGPYQFVTYKDAGMHVQDIASALKAIGLSRGGAVGIYGGNCPEWMIAMQACNRMALVCVPIYDSLGENAIDFIIKHSEASAAFIAAAKLPAFLKAFPAVANLVKTVVYWGNAGADTVEKIKQLGVANYSWEELRALGSKTPAPADPPAPADLCTIMYTSGTTGDPKGVMITHTNVIKTIAFLRATLAAYKITLNKNDSFLSFLPLAHIFDRVVEELCLEVGASIGYWQGDASKLVQDLGALRPTIFVGVPRIFDRIYTKAMAAVNGSAPRRVLFGIAKRIKLHAMKRRGLSRLLVPLLDVMVFKKFKAGLGGRVRIVCSGGAPLAPHVEEFLRVTMCCPVVQGYGLTETCAASFASVPDDMDQMATVGPPFVGVKFRLQSVPEMGYDALDPEEPKGEVLILSPQTFKGYYKNQSMTEEAVKDGWFYTGDIGTITADGALKIIDRKKNIFKLSIGEYIAAEKLEATYKKNLVVDQVWVYGNSFKSSIIAVVVPNKHSISEFAQSKGLQGSFQELCDHPAVAAHVLEELTATARADKLKGFEVVKAVILDHEQFSTENDLMTPSFKLKRAPLLKKYEPRIEQAYVAVERAENEKERAREGQKGK